MPVADDHIAPLASTVDDSLFNTPVQSLETQFVIKESSRKKAVELKKLSAQCPKADAVASGFLADETATDYPVRLRSVPGRQRSRNRAGHGRLANPSVASRLSCVTKRCVLAGRSQLSPRGAWQRVKRLKRIFAFKKKLKRLKMRRSGAVVELTSAVHSTNALPYAFAEKPRPDEDIVGNSPLVTVDGKAAQINVSKGTHSRTHAQLSAIQQLQTLEASHLRSRSVVSDQPSTTNFTVPQPSVSLSQACLANVKERCRAGRVLQNSRDDLHPASAVASTATYNVPNSNATPLDCEDSREEVIVGLRMSNSLPCLLLRPELLETAAAQKQDLVLLRRSRYNEGWSV